MNRRGFLAGMLALGVAPAIVTSKGVFGAFEPRNPLQELVAYARRMHIPPGPDGNYVAYLGRNVFAQLTPEQKRLWAADVWRKANESAFLARFLEPAAGLIIPVQDDRITVAPPNPVLALRQQLRLRAG